MTNNTHNTLITKEQFKEQFLAHAWPSPSLKLRQRILADYRTAQGQALALPFGLSRREAGLFLSSLLLVGFLSGTLVGLNTPTHLAAATTVQSLSYQSTGAALMTQLYHQAGDAK